MSWWIVDDDYDRDMSSDGHSRYGAYLADRLKNLYEDYEPAGGVDVEWVMWCWNVATPPIMAPGYARWRSPVAGTELFREEWDGRLAATVHVLTPVYLGHGWRTWSPDFSGRLEEPREWPRATGEVQLSDRLELSEELRRPERPADVALTTEAQRVVGMVVGALHRHFGDAVDRLAAASFEAR